MKRRPIPAICLYFGSSFVLHLVFEHFQMRLYALPPLSLWKGIGMCLFATATGDMLFTLTLYLTVALIHKNLCWVAERSSYAHPATWVVPVIVGVLLAVGFELWAVYAVKRWEYGAMPLIPIVGVGVTPVLQMIVVPIVATASCRWWALRQSSTPPQ